MWMEPGSCCCSESALFRQQHCSSCRASNIFGFKHTKSTFNRRSFPSRAALKTTFLNSIVALYLYVDLWPWDHFNMVLSSKLSHKLITLHTWGKITGYRRGGCEGLTLTAVCSQQCWNETCPLTRPSNRWSCCLSARPLIGPNGQHRA